MSKTPSIGKGFKTTKEQKRLEQLAENPQTPPHLLSELAQSFNTSIRRYVAKNLSTPTETLVKLTKDPDREVRESALNNPCVPPLSTHYEILLDTYKLLLAQTEAESTAIAYKLLASRLGSPYTLAQVLEKGDRNAKLKVADNCKTPIHLLEQLAKDSDEVVRRTVLENSNLPLNSLLELARDKSVNIRLALAAKPFHKKTPTPIQLLEQLAQDEAVEVRARIAEHPDTPVELLIRLASDSSYQVKARLTGNPNTPITILTRLGLEENLVNERNPHTPGEVLASLVNSMLRQSHQKGSGWMVESTNKGLLELIKYPIKGSQMPANILDRLASYNYPPVRMSVAAHPNTAISTLEKLVRDSYVPTLTLLAKNPNTPSNVLEQLANNPDLTIRLDVVSHPNTPARVLTQILEDVQRSANVPNRTKDTLKSAFPGDAYYLLFAVAANPRTPTDALEILARREFISPTPDPKFIFSPKTDDDVVRSLAYNPNLNSALIHILTQDPCVQVRIILTRHPNLTEALWMRLAEDNEISVRKAIASRPNCPVKVLEKLASDENEEVRTTVANNPKTPVSILAILADYDNSYVRTATASNPNLPEAILTQLAADEKVEVRRAVARNPNTPPSIRDNLRDLVVKPNQHQAISPTLRSLSRLYNPNTDDLPTILAEYSQSENDFVRFITLMNPQTPLEILSQAIKSSSWLERYAVAENPALSESIRQYLTQDSNRIVRAAALENS